MSYRLLAVATLLAGAVACRVIPTESGSAVADGPTPAVAPGALAAIRAVVDDPLVHGLVAGLHDPAARQRVGDALSAITRAAADALPSLDATLLEARAQVARAGATDDQAAQAALSLLLDHAGATLDASRLTLTGAPQRRAAR